MILLDTHVWVWWIHADKNLTQKQSKIIKENEETGIGISAISLWEVAKLVERQRLVLPCSIKEWFDQALSYPGIQILDLTPEIAIESTQLPGDFHRDPADQINVATSRIYNYLLVTSDKKLLDYTHVVSIA
jgi:PIN domain nuclease of toxin-antitoxin system